MSRSPTSRRPDYRWARFRRRYFARRVVYPWELPTIMRKHIYTGVMGSVYFYLIGGLFFVTFGNRIGLSRFQWGLMGGLSSFLLSAQLISALITRRAGRRKRLWFWCAVAGRSIRFVGIFLALLLWHLGWRESGVVLITAVCIANFFGAMAAPPWYSWLADIIPEEEHGGFWGRRSWWIGFWVVCTAVPLGFLLDAVGETYKLPVVTSIFFAASVVGLLDLVIHGTIPEPAMVKPPREHFLRHLIEPLRDRGFRPWLIFNGCWTFGMTLGGALATVYFVQELGIERNMKWGALVLMAFPLVGGLVTARWSGRLVDRVGPKRVLMGGHLFWALLPLFWIWATPETAVVWLGCSSLLGGASSTAAVTAANKLITRFPPPTHRAMYVAVSSCLGSLAGGVGVLLAGTVLKLAGDWSFPALGTAIGGFQLLFLASFCLRLASAAFLIRPIRDPAQTEPAA